ncbi:MAG: ABC transporter ATP-binding protein [Thermodesulfobacteriaceae bacterium]|nr:ABC transporter ATP-binding protein [Thermodesulfobacteriaceae bacterium]MCX8041535.1 ABC transporter ATP-binding protein [Thermodesulfobacteriaceae bacterium]MDW8135984.1 ABC transporter ATP-binding protein [Thermodesulfobacterium sp.]
MNFLEVKDLTLGLKGAYLPLVEKVSFSLKKGQTLGIVGESGCGKSLTGLSLLRLFPPGIIPYQGNIFLDGLSLFEIPERELYKIRGKRIAIILQDPLTALNPVLTIEEQVEEVLKVHFNFSKKERRERIYQLLSEVGIAEPKIRARSYPHELSGGLRQRAMIAMALAGNPEILIADEPTTALDPTLQIQILELLKILKEERQLTLIFITHDLALVRYLADQIAVFYAGEIVEIAPTEVLFQNPLHPYTQTLISIFEKVEVPLKTLPVNLLNKPKGCRYGERCFLDCKEGHKEHPELLQINSFHRVRCWKYV